MRIIADFIGVFPLIAIETEKPEVVFFSLEKY